MHLVKLAGIGLTPETTKKNCKQIITTKVHYLCSTKIENHKAYIQLQNRF